MPSEIIVLDELVPVTLAVIAGIIYLIDLIPRSFKEYVQNKNRQPRDE